MPFRPVVVAAVLTAALAPSAARAAPDVVGTASHAVFGARAWGGHLVFSELDPATKKWSLKDATVSGIRALSVAPENAAFEMDVGPDAKGAPAVVYSHCADQGLQNGCRIFELSLADPGASPVEVVALKASSFNDVAPSIWNGRIAFGRWRPPPHRRPIGVPRVARVYLQRSPGSARLKLLARGSVPREDADPNCCGPFAMPDAIDLGPRGLALLWGLSGGNAFAQDDQELWRIPLDGRRGTLLDVGGAGECGFGGDSFRQFASPSIAGGQVSYLAATGDCYATHSLLTTTGPSPLHQQRHGFAAPVVAYAAARDGRRWWTITAPVPSDPVAAEDDPCGAGGCNVAVDDAVSFARVHVRRRPVPPLDCPGHVDETCGRPLLAGQPRSAAQLRRYLARRFSVFREARRPIDVLPAHARSALGLSAADDAGSRFLARIGGHAAYIVPESPSGVCLLATAHPDARSCSPATSVVRGLQNVFPAIALAHHRRLFMAVLPDGARAARLRRAGGATIRLRPYRNFVARVLPGRPGTGGWMFTWKSGAGAPHAASVG